MFEIVKVPNLNLTGNFVFWTKFAQNRYFWSKADKVYSTIKGYVLNFILNNPVFWNKFAQKDYFRSKAEK